MHELDDKFYEPSNNDVENNGSSAMKTSCVNKHKRKKAGTASGPHHAVSEYKNV
jgi:hypothetical protein